MGSGGPWSNQIQSVVVVGGSPPAVVGVFLYNGQPGAGNPPVAWMSRSATDPYGNSLPAQDIVSYNQALTVYTQMTAGQLNVGKTGASAPGSVAQSSNALHPGAMILTSPVATGGNTFSQLIMEDSGETSGPIIVATTPIAARDPAASTIFTADTWHDLGTLAGYTVNRAQYKLGPEDQTWLYVNVTGGGANAANVSFSNTLAVAYRPLAAVIQPLTASGTAPASLPRVSLNSSGTVTVSTSANIVNQLIGVVPIPLD